MKIGVLSDTHSRDLPRQMIDDFKKTDLIIHAGDICSKDFLDQLAKIKDVKAVCGNMDDQSLRSILPRRQIVQCGSCAIGVFHGEGHPHQLLECVKKEFLGQKVDVIIFGHSHQPMNEKIQDVLFFNPGSPTDTVFAPYRSYGILEINGSVSGRIIKINDD